MALKAHLEQTSLTESAPFERRRQPRRALRLETSGSLERGLEANVTVHNISAAGLLIETALPLMTGEVLAIVLPDVGPVGAEIVWQSGQLFGCAFEQALGEAALAAAQLRGTAAIGENADAANAKLQFGTATGDTLGVKLNRLRRERGLTLAQVADALDVSKPTVWAWEKGKARPLPERIGAIAAVLGVEESALTESVASGPAAQLVEDCRQKLADAFGVEVQNVRIMIEV